MSEVAFAIHMGGGFYMDSNGGLHDGPPPNVPVYKAPYELPVDPKKVKNALADVKDLLKDIDNQPDLVLLLHVWKAEKTLLNILSQVGKIAGMIAPVFAVAGFAVDIAKFLGFLKDGPSALERLVIQRFDQLEREVRAIADLIHTKDLRNGRIAVENFTAAVRNYVGMLGQLNPSLSQLQQDYNRLLGQHEDHIDWISTLLDQQTWLTPFDRTEHETVWPLVQHVLHTLPGGPKSAPKPALMPAAGSLHFDHRLMVPMASFAAESYLAGIRGISPEYRTTGDFRYNLRNFAQKLGDCAQAMREHVLARTIYRPDHFRALISPYEVDHTGVFPGTGTLSISPQCSRWPVGALDLRYHTDEYFDAFLKNLWKSEFLGWPHETKYGGFNFRWIPPAKLEPAEFGNYRIANPEECAAAANAQSEQDYAELLSLSGYAELLQLTMLLRNEATEPDKSQTVRPGKVNLLRNPQPSETVTVESKPVRFTGEVIRAKARREPQECSARVRIRTQALNRALPVKYQIWLRTLDSVLSQDSWYERTYASHQRVDYEPDPADSRFLRLVLTMNNTALDEHGLVEQWSASPRDESIHREGTAEMTADTFDWWIPVSTPFSIDKPFHKTLAELQSIGWSVGLEREDRLSVSSAMNIMSHGNGFGPASVARPIANLVPELFWKPGAPDWDGQHREVKRKKVSVRYTLDWDADVLTVTIRNEVPDRNYVVYVVVEEMFTGSGNILHTAVPIPVNGLLTYVPEKFFADELAAFAKTAAMIRDFAGRYIPTVDDIGPSDPIAWLRPGDLASPGATARLAEHIQLNHPDLLRKYLSEVDTVDQQKKARRERRPGLTRKDKSRPKATTSA